MPHPLALVEPFKPGLLGTVLTHVYRDEPATGIQDPPEFCQEIEHVGVVEHVKRPVRIGKVPHQSRVSQDHSPSPSMREALATSAAGTAFPLIPLEVLAPNNAGRGIEADQAECYHALVVTGSAAGSCRHDTAVCHWTD